MTKRTNLLFKIMQQYAGCEQNKIHTFLYSHMVLSDTWNEKKGLQKIRLQISWTQAYWDATNGAIYIFWYHTNWGIWHPCRGQFRTVNKITWFILSSWEIIFIFLGLFSSTDRLTYLAAGSHQSLPTGAVWSVWTDLAGNETIFE